MGEAPVHRILERILVGLFYANPHQFSLFKCRSNQAIHSYAQILRRRHMILKERVEIKIRMIESIHYFPLDASIKGNKIAHHSGLRINLTTYRNFDYIIVTVSMRVIAFAIDFTILLCAEYLVMETMRRAEAISPRKIGPHGSP
jgi:hypothetical protein